MNPPDKGNGARLFGAFGFLETVDEKAVVGAAALATFLFVDLFFDFLAAIDLFLVAFLVDLFLVDFFLEDFFLADLFAFFLTIKLHLFFKYNYLFVDYAFLKVWFIFQQNLN